MKDITNANNINAWSQIPFEALEAFGDEGDFARQHLLTPTLFALIGDVQGKMVLDAGSGQGYLSRKLAQQGAIVTAIEPAENMYKYACLREQNEPLGITYLQQDLSSLSSITSVFDIVVANMVFMDIPDYKTAIHNCITSLKSGGSFIFSISHPCFEEPGLEWLKKGYVEVRDYFQETSVSSTIGHHFHRPLHAYLNTIIQEGCILQRIVEPQLNGEVALQHGPIHMRNVYVPQFLVIQATRA